jgi:predicted O-methyltransferase YrrM
VDAARNQLASDALGAGFTELMWIDSDVVFDPDDVERLRAHNLPFTCGIYPKKGPREFACEFLPNTPQVRFGRHGGLAEIRYCGFGFTHIRKEVFVAIHQRFNLPVCNRRFNTALVPFFQPLVVEEPTGPWSLSEDYAFCERARQCGFRVQADTSLRLWHVGSYRYGWEDAGGSRDRFTDYTFRLSGLPGFPGVPPAPASPAPTVGFTEDWFSDNVPVWQRLFAPLVGKPIHALEIGVFEGRSTVWLLEHVLTNPDASLTWIDTFAGGAEHTGVNLAGLEARFRANTQAFAQKLRGHVGRSQDVLRGLRGEQFDLVYIDGSHEAPDVLADAVLSWPLLKPGGLLGFDDYGWKAFPEPQRCPALAVDAFLTVMQGQFTEVHHGYQVWAQKHRTS